MLVTSLDWTLGTWQWPRYLNPDKSVMWWEGRPTGRQAPHPLSTHSGHVLSHWSCFSSQEDICAQGWVRFYKRKSSQETIMADDSGRN